jgi:hypothetical protein
MCVFFDYSIRGVSARFATKANVHVYHLLLTCAVQLLAGCSAAKPRKPVLSEPQLLARSHASLFITEWRAAQQRSAVISSPLLSVKIGSSSRLKDSSLVLLDLRGVCTRLYRADPNEPYARFHSRPIVELVDSIRVPKNTDTAYCPYWWQPAPLLPTLVQQQERFFLPADLTFVRARRAVLLDTLTALSRLAPLDPVIVGQLTRFAIDHGTPERADTAVARCASEVPFCTRLAALLAFHRGEAARAESLFLHARAAAPSACGDSLVRLLAPSLGDPDARCPMTREQDARVWWLADPLWGTPVNERRLEHERRRLDYEIRLAVARDEFFDFSRQQVTTALPALIRYGWPSNFQPRGLTSRMGLWYYGDTDDTTWTAGALNYSPDRIATVPPARVLDAPTRSTPADWALPVYDPTRFRNPWPREHLRLPVPFRTSERLQWARFYRPDPDSLAQLVLVYARSPYRDPEPPTSDEAHAFVWMADPTTRRPGTISLATATTLAATLRTPLRDGVASLEALPPRPALWRARFGVPALTPPPSGAPFLSDLLLTRPDVSTPQPPEGGLVDYLLSDFTLDPGTSAVGLYWELYRAAPTDTVTYTLLVRRDDGGSLGDALARLLTGGRREGAQGISWRVPPRATPQPYRPATVDLNVAALPPGRYTLSLEARGPAFTAKTEPRMLVVRER